MALDRLRLISKGYSGANGYTNLYFTAVTSSILTALNTFLTALKSLQPINVAYQFPAAGDTIDETTGKLIGGWSVGSAPGDLAMTGGLAYSAPTGFLVEWRTTGVVDGHRPIGKTYFVPAASAAFNNSGGILNTAATTITAAAQLFVSGTSGFSIWHRPKHDETDPARPIIRPGSAVPVVSGVTGPKAVVLRSRRD